MASESRGRHRSAVLERKRYDRMGSVASWPGRARSPFGRARSVSMVTPSRDAGGFFNRDFAMLMEKWEQDAFVKAALSDRGRGNRPALASSTVKGQETRAKKHQQRPRKTRSTISAADIYQASVEARQRQRLSYPLSFRPRQRIVRHSVDGMLKETKGGDRPAGFHGIGTY